MLNFYLDDVLLKDPPVEFMDIVIDITFEGDAINSTINIDTFSFVKGARDKVLNHVATRIFEGIDFRIEENTEVLYDGMLDFIQQYKDDDGLKAICKLQQKDAIDFIDQRLKGITFGLLKDRGVELNYTDVPVIVIKKFDETDAALLTFASFTIFQVTYDLFYKQGKDAISKIRIIISSPLNIPKEIAAAILELLFLAAYVLLMIKLIYDLLTKVVNILVPPRSDYKGITYRDALTALYGFVGLEFRSTIPEMDWVYLPSKKGENVRESRKEDGIPMPEDYGYVGGDMIQLVLDLFYARPKVEGNVVHIEPLKGNYWKKRRSSYVLPDVRTPIFMPNTNELVSTRVISYATDVTDDWTVDNYPGTSVEISTEQDNYLKEDNKLIRGYEETRFQVALGTQKDTFSNLEDVLNGFIKLIHGITKAFGNKSKLTTIDIGRDRLKISQPFFNVPKNINLVDGSVGPRNEVSAKFLWDKYGNEQSFVFNAQELIYNDIKIKFQFEDFQLNKNNNYFEDYNGNEGIFKRINWLRGSDFAIVSYRIKDVYCKLLKETIIEP